MAVNLLGSYEPAFYAFSCSCSLCQLLTLEKFQLVIASLTSSVSVLPGGSTSVGDGRLVQEDRSQPA